MADFPIARPAVSTSGVSIIGGAELIRAMDRLSDKAKVDSLAVAGRAGAVVVQRKWKSLFRKKTDASFPGSLPRRQTGQYAQSIHVEILERGPMHVIVAVGTSIKDPPYPVFLEYGTSKMPPHPIARPAWDQSKMDALQEIAVVLRRRLGL